MLGRLASIVAKQLLIGQKIVVVRSEQINISGTLSRSKLKYKDFLRKRSVVNPRRGGNIHYRAPSRIFWRVVRGMLPHKTARGATAMEHLKVFEGLPSPYDTKKRLVVPAALRVLRLKPGRAFCSVGRLSHEFGWKYQSIVATLEEKRKAISAAYYDKKKSLNRLIKKAASIKASEIAPIATKLAALGF